MPATVPEHCFPSAKIAEKAWLTKQLGGFYLSMGISKAS